MMFYVFYDCVFIIGLHVLLLSRTHDGHSYIIFNNMILRITYYDILGERDECKIGERRVQVRYKRGRGCSH